MAPPGADSASSLCGLNAGDIGREVGNGERQISGDAHERTHAHDFVVADLVDGGDANDLSGKSWLFGGRQAIALVRAFFAAAKRATERDFDAFRQSGKIGFTVEGCENGAAHESSAAKRGHNRAGKPLHRNASAIDKAAQAAIDRQRRFVAELDGLGLP
jgi:hypothetical protein